MLALSPEAWNFFPVYPSDFVREVVHVTTDGLAHVVLHVHPCARHDRPLTEGEIWSDFAWGPSDSYHMFTRIAAIVFVAVSAAGSENSDIAAAPELPPWLVHDLGAIRAQYSHHGGLVQRALHSLKATIHNGVANRRIDPLMVPMLLQTLCSEKDSATPADIIRRYKAQVFYDSRLVLDPSMTAVQQYLLDPTKCIAGKLGVRKRALTRLPPTRDAKTNGEGARESGHTLLHRTNQVAGWSG